MTDSHLGWARFGSAVGSLLLASACTSNSEPSLGTARASEVEAAAPVVLLEAGLTDARLEAGAAQVNTPVPVPSDSTSSSAVDEAPASVEDPMEASSSVVAEVIDAASVVPNTPRDAGRSTAEDSGSNSGGGAEGALDSGASTSAGGAGGASPSCEPSTVESPVPVPEFDAGAFAPFGCTAPQDLLTGCVPNGFAQCAEGHVVRLSQETCPNLLPPKHELDGGAPMYCNSHEECPGRLGFCYSWGPFGAQCSAGCETDSDCAADEVCHCRDPIGLCQKATCATSNDCEAGSFCAAVETSLCSTVYEFACQGPEDECRSDSDCTHLKLGDWCTAEEGVKRCREHDRCR